MFQACLGAVTCGLTVLLGCRLFDRSTGLLAGLMTAFYGPLIFFESELLGSGWAAFWAVSLLLLLDRARATPLATDHACSWGSSRGSLSSPVRRLFPSSALRGFGFGWGFGMAILGVEDERWLSLWVPF